jgi:hypothetical protein
MKNDKLKNLVTLVEDLKKKMQADGKEALQVAFNEFFNNHPTAEKIIWTQYTPYFNDGDACTFGVNDFELKLNVPLSKNDEDDDDNDSYHYGDGDAASDLQDNKNISAEDKAMCDDFHELEKSCMKVKVVLETIFGDHCTVIASRKGFDIHEFEHD